MLCVLLIPWAAASAQDDPPSLGDFARNLRKDKSQQPPQSQTDHARTVIDNDNMAQVMEDAKKAKPIKQDKTVFSIDPSGNTLKVSSPDVTCSLSFNARAASLIVKPMLIEDLPLAELVKLDGPGSIQDESLQLEVFNGSDWERPSGVPSANHSSRPGTCAQRGRAAFRRYAALSPQS